MEQKKMSKSDPSDMSKILLTDDKDSIALKIKKSKTDPYILPDNIELLKNRPEASNLLTIFAVLSDLSINDVVKQFAGRDFSYLKKTAN